MPEPLTVNGIRVADFHDGTARDKGLSPRPYLHPVRTLGGTVVTDAQPDDHPWHLGVSVGIPDVDGTNFWGGPTYVHGEGYVACANHGRIEAAGGNRLRWLDRHDELLLTERRTITAQEADNGWELHLATALTNATDRVLRLASPASNGREGAGYGGLFWRLPRTGRPTVRTPEATGQDAVHGSTASPLIWMDERFTLVFTATPADPWFVRVRDYPGVGTQLAGADPVLLAPGDTLTRALHVVIADGMLSA